MPARAQCKRAIINYIVLCFIKLQILARIFSFPLLRSQYVCVDVLDIDRFL